MEPKKLIWLALICLGLAVTLLVLLLGRPSDIKSKLRTVGFFLRRINFYPSLINRYSLPLLAIMLWLLWTGSHLLFNGNLWGLIHLTIGILMTQGFKQPKDTPRRVWLITFLGQQTTTIVDQLTLLLDWFGISIIGHVEFVIKQVNHDFKLKKPIKCKGGGYIYGLISAGIIVDENDDPPGTPNWKSGGEKLRNFTKAGGDESMAAIITHVDDILTAWIQQFATHHDIDWMESHSLELGALILPCIEGKESIADLRNKLRNLPPHLNNREMLATLAGIENTDIDDTRHLGIKFEKFEPILKPSDEVIEARNRLIVERANRDSQLENTRNMNDKIRERMILHHRGIVENGVVIVPPDQPDKRLSAREARNDLFMEDLAEDKKVTVILNEKGVNVAQVNTQQGGNP